MQTNNKQGCGENDTPRCAFMDSIHIHDISPCFLKQTAMKALYYKLFKRRIYKRAKRIKLERAMREYKEAWVKAVNLIYGYDNPEKLIDMLDTNTDSYDNNKYEWPINKANELRSKQIWKKTE